MLSKLAKYYFKKHSVTYIQNVVFFSKYVVFFSKYIIKLQ